MNNYALSIVFLFSASAVFCQTPQKQQEVNSSTIVFVCEHGSARSVIAAAHFNRLATEKGLPFRAVSRGKNPDETISANIRDSLAGDGLDVSAWKPRALGDADVQKAAKVVALSVDLPSAKATASDRLLEWKDVPAMSQSYETVRKIIVRHVSELVQNLSTAKPQ